MIEKAKTRVEIEELNEVYALKRKILEDVDPIRKKERKKEIRRHSILFVIEIFILAVILFIVSCVFLGMATVHGKSMYPALREGNLVVYEKHTREYKAGDIVVLRRPDGEEFVKRIVAVAGDTVNIQKGKLYINGEEYSSEEIGGRTDCVNPEISNPYLVLEEEVFVLGDNRENSEDSRSFGAVKLRNLKGKLLYYIGKTD